MHGHVHTNTHLHVRTHTHTHRGYWLFSSRLSSLELWPQAQTLIATVDLRPPGWGPGKASILFRVFTHNWPNGWNLALRIMSPGYRFHVWFSSQNTKGPKSDFNLAILGRLLRKSNLAANLKCRLVPGPSRSTHCCWRRLPHQSLSIATFGAGSLASISFTVEELMHFKVEAVIN